MSIETYAPEPRRCAIRAQRREEGALGSSVWPGLPGWGLCTCGQEASTPCGGGEGIVCSRRSEGVEHLIGTWSEHREMRKEAEKSLRTDHRRPRHQLESLALESWPRQSYAARGCRERGRGQMGAWQRAHSSSADPQC